MKKLLLLVSCCAVVLILSQVSFAQEAAVETATPCPCVGCGAVTPFATPFAYPPQRQFGGRLAGLIGKRSFAPQMLSAPASTEGPVALPYPYGISDLRPRAVRRVARLTPQPQPYPVPYPVAVVPPAASAQPTATDTATGSGAPSTFAPGPIVQTGALKNISVQRSGYTAPVINFLSVVRGGAHPAYYPHYPVQAQ